MNQCVKYALKGDVVTLNSRRKVLREGYVVIQEERIAYIGPVEQGLPARFHDFTEIDTEGYIYPGLIDLHNHLPYNFLNLWPIVKKFEDRYQWPRLSKYKSEIAAPTKLLANSNAVELMKYAESKALASGTTSIDGYSKFNRSYAAWLLRNVEVEPFGKLESKIYQSVLRIKNEEEFLIVDRKMNEGNAFIYHLAEGTSEGLLEEYTELKDHGLIRDNLVGIHCTALNANNWKELGKKGVKFVWSPLSNLLLYGKTADVVAAKKNGVIISLGSDWSPTGSKNILWELKVADLYNNNSLNNFFTDIELVEMVTCNPAKAIRVADQIGSIKAGLFADLVIFNKLEDDPYRNLIQCTEKDLKLSIISGRPRYGDIKYMSSLKIAGTEKIKVGSVTKGIDILELGVEFGEITFQEVWSRLTESLANPRKTALRLFEKSKIAPAAGEEQPIRLIIEDETEEVREGLAVTPEMTFESFLQSNFDTQQFQPLVPDSLSMHGDVDFFRDLKANPNMPTYMSDLKNYLR